MAALRQARLAAGLSQAEVAKRARVSRTNYVSFETGKRTPGVSFLRRFAAAVGVETRDLVTLDPATATLRDLRTRAGKTQAAAAAELGYRSASSYANIETGLTTPSSDQIATLARFFDASLSELALVAARSTAPE